LHRLVVAERGRTWVLDLDGTARVTVGRGRKSTVVLADTAASREHCSLEKDPEGFWLTDLESRNGTRLNGRRVRARALVQPGDRIEIGDARLVLEDGGRRGPADPSLARDADTGVHSYAYVRAELDRILSGGGKVGVAKLDVDSLGLLNAVFGHESGDAALATIATETEAAVKALEKDAIVGRESGGKLVILAAGADAERVRVLADSARERVAKAAQSGALPLPGVTLSGGAASAPPCRSARALLRSAEAALEEAKRLGRDRVAVASTPGAERSRATFHERGSESTGEAASLIAGALPAEEPLLLQPAGQKALGLVSRALASDLDLDGLAELVLGVIAKETGAERGLLVLKDDQGELRLGAAVSPGSAPGTPVAPASHGLLRAALASKQGILLQDAQADVELGRHESVAASGARSVVGAPILHGDEVLGAIELENNVGPGLFDRAALDLVRAFGRIVGGPIRRGLLHRRALDELARAQVALRGTREEEARLLDRYRGIVGRSAALKRLLRTIDRIADRPLPVLINGESGTGKELVARALHARSRRARAPFVAENCAALPDELLEAELFGHVKGAFTGADRDRTGLLEAADHGTLFLDEVGDMSPRLQSKLLRFLESGELRRLGDEKTRVVSVRVVAATNRVLEDMVQKGEFREDLYYRLAVLRVKIPPLRERREDVPLLVAHFAAKAARELGRAAPTFTPETLEVLASHEWPGNVRQLENEVRRLVALGLDPVKAEHLSTDLVGAGAPGAGAATRDASLAMVAEAVLHEVAATSSLEEALDGVERKVLARVLEETRGNRSETARRLGLSRTGLRKKMRRLGLE
jgi:Nif-specific regulatory protein